MTQPVEIEFLDGVTEPAKQVHVDPSLPSRGDFPQLLGQGSVLPYPAERGTDVPYRAQRILEPVPEPET
jgi:hypothetical protein